MSNIHAPPWICDPGPGAELGRQRRLGDGESAYNPRRSNFVVMLSAAPQAAQLLFQRLLFNGAACTDAGRSAITTGLRPDMPAMPLTRTPGSFMSGTGELHSGRRLVPGGAAPAKRWDNMVMNAPQPTSPHRRLQELLAIPEGQRTDAQWDEIHELEIKLSSANREQTLEQGAQRNTPGPAARHPKSGGGAQGKKPFTRGHKRRPKANLP